MGISPIKGVSGVEPPSVVSAIKGTSPSAKSGSSFGKVISELVKESNSQHSQADQSLNDLISGETDNLHNVVIDAARADLSFRLLMEIRNKLLDAYQEIMRMQV